MNSFIVNEYGMFRQRRLLPRLLDGGFETLIFTITSPYK